MNTEALSLSPPYSVSKQIIVFANKDYMILPCLNDS